MELDGLTLMVAGCFVAMLGGLILVSAWLQNRDGTTALLWWAAGHFVNAVGAGSLIVALGWSSPSAAVFGAGAIVLSMALYFGGTRAFFARPAVPWPIGMAVLSWLLVTSLTLPRGPRGSVVAFAVVTVLVMCSAAIEIARERRESLISRWPLAGIFALHGLFMIAGLVALFFGNIAIELAPSPDSWFALIHFERLVFFVGSTVFMIGIVRERMTVATTAAAHVDSLTGVANRGAFFTAAERVCRRGREDGAMLSVIVFDLDHFKNINDTHGHMVGDRVLKSFAETANRVLRPGDLFGRIGGEEFAVVLPGADAEAARLIAERVRHAFASLPTIAGGIAVRATVSGGVATAAAQLPRMDALLEAADVALYRAKAHGRNRIDAALLAREPAAAAMRVA